MPPESPPCTSNRIRNPKKQEEIKSLSLFNRIINAIDVRIHAGFGAGYF
jgi:hypothetical protein